MGVHNERRCATSLFGGSPFICIFCPLPKDPSTLQHTVLVLWLLVISCKYAHCTATYCLCCVSQVRQACLMSQRCLFPEFQVSLSTSYWCQNQALAHNGFPSSYEGLSLSCGQTTCALTQNSQYKSHITGRCVLFLKSACIGCLKYKQPLDRANFDL